MRRNRNRAIVGVAVLALAVAAIMGSQTGLGRVDAGPKLTVIPGCTVALADTLRDPESLELVDEPEVSPLDPPHEGWGIVGEYRARNGFGGMNSDLWFCTTDADGAVVEVQTAEGLDD